MEALTAVAVAALTVYDMVKAVDKAMVIERIVPGREARRTSGDVVKGRSPDRVTVTRPTRGRVRD